jgi:hypothetical protein
MLGKARAMLGEGRGRCFIGIRGIQRRSGWFQGGRFPTLPTVPFPKIRPQAGQGSIASKGANRQ